MRIPVTPVVVMIFGLSLSISAQEFVYGDPATNKYYGVNCQEMQSIGAGKVRGFASPAKAEAAGFTRADKCTPKQTITLAVPIGGSQVSRNQKPRNESTLVRDLRKDSVTIEMINTEFRKYRLETVKFVGEIEVFASYHGKYRGKERDIWAFRINDGNWYGYFYMPKTVHSDAIRSVIMALRQDQELIWTCSIIPEEMLNDANVIGSIVKCEPHFIR